MQNSSFIGQLFLNHTVLIVPPLIVAFICAVLIGALGAQYPRAQEIIGGVCQLLYTIPSLPLLVITPIFLGVSITSPVTVMVALGLYAVALLVRTSIDAFASVDSTHLQSAETLGYGPWRITFGVRCVLALRNNVNSFTGVDWGIGRGVVFGDTTHRWFPTFTDRRSCHRDHSNCGYGFTL